MLWCETSTPDLGEARHFAEAVHRRFPGKLLAYNCSPSFNWRKHLDDATIARFQHELGAMGYKFQFVTLAGFHGGLALTLAVGESTEEKQFYSAGCARTPTQTSTTVARSVGCLAARGRRLP